VTTTRAAFHRRLRAWRARVATFIFVLVASLSSPARAADESAEELKTRGNQAMMELNYAEALVNYRGALEKNPHDVVLHYNIGRAHQARGDYPAALDALLEFEKKAPPETRAKVPSLGQLISDVRGRVGELAIHCSSDIAKGVVVVTTAGLGGAELARVDSCGTVPRKVRVSVQQKTTNVEVRLESDRVDAAPIKVALEGGGATADVAFSIVARTNSGVLHVRATPGNAIVAVDGVARGNSPVEIVLPAGPHVVDVTADSYDKAHVPFVVDAGGRKELNLTLEKTPPLSKRWWFWTGAGVLVAGALTAAAILIIQPENEGTKGSIDPGIIRAPLTF
jgi:hypothetical protein